METHHRCVNQSAQPMAIGLLTQIDLRKGQERLNSDMNPADTGKVIRRLGAYLGVGVKPPELPMDTC